MMDLMIQGSRNSTHFSPSHHHPTHPLSIPTHFNQDAKGQQEKKTRKERGRVRRELGSERVGKLLLPERGKVLAAAHDNLTWLKMGGGGCVRWAENIKGAAMGTPETIITTT